MTVIPNEVANPPIIYLIGFLSVFSIDPYEGDPKKALTWGTTLNHSREKANVKPYVAGRNSVNPRFFFWWPHIK